MEQRVFAYFDGDDVGAGLELLLLDGHLDEASRYSGHLSEGMQELKREIIGIPGAEVILCGGDDLFATWPRGVIDVDVIALLRKKFEVQTSRTVSVGIGESPKIALENLHRAKLMGRNQVVSTIDELG